MTKIAPNDGRSSRGTPPGREQPSLSRDALLVLTGALVLRLVFMGLTADAYDPDEFVVLALARAAAHGGTPYRDFTFFHPPGVLMLFRAVQPVVGAWWPAGRMLVSVIDSVTALLVWRIGTLLYSRREALAAGLLYAVSPIPLLAAVRIGQDTLITALGTAGLLLLLSRRQQMGPLLAGICLGVAFWIKYPALLFLPIYVLAAPRRIGSVVAGALAATALLFAPLLADLHALWAQTVTWQLTRPHDALLRRAAAVFSFWLLLNPLAVVALAWRRRYPVWLLTGFGAGILFLFGAEAYYHYFVPVGPFAALLGAPVFLWLLERVPRLVVAGAALLLAAWATALNIGPVEAGLGALRLSAVRPTIQLLDHLTPRHARLVSDEFEYGYLAQRAPATDYFWDMSNVARTATLQRSLRGAAAVVVTRGNVPAYPRGFLDYLEDRGYVAVRTGTATVWLLSERSARASG